MRLSGFLVPVFQVIQEGCLATVAFSPVDPMVVATAGQCGTKLYDIRQTHSGILFIHNKFSRVFLINFTIFISSCAHTCSNIPNNSVRFNRQGTRLLCRESLRLPTVYNVPQAANNISGKVQFSAPDYVTPTTGRDIHCFAGPEDELVVAASADYGLYVWSFPTDHLSDLIVDQSLVVLKGHKDQICSVCYNRQSDTWASAGAGKIIMLWTPITE